jgi:hypothetical protein
MPFLTLVERNTGDFRVRIRQDQLGDRFLAPNQACIVRQSHVAFSCYTRPNQGFEDGQDSGG